MLKVVSLLPITLALVFLTFCTPAITKTNSNVDITSQIKLPKGFKIDIFAKNVNNARSMTMGTKGTLFVGTRENKVYAITSKNNKSNKVITIAGGLNMPNGVAFRNGSLYVAEISRILRYDKIEENLTHPPKPVIIVDNLPNKTHHGWRYIAFGTDGKLYVPIGAPCNVCKSGDDQRFGTLMRMNPDGSNQEIYARGIRNTVGFDWSTSNNLWFTDNGRDMLGDYLPPDELNNAPKIGMNFGFPYCHGGYISDPEFGREKKCSEFSPPAIKLGAHVAPLGMKFYKGNMFPDKYKNRIFIAEHGSWNRTNFSGYRISSVIIKNNKAIKYENFADGWLKSGNRSIGRPVDILIMNDGSMLVSDDTANIIYRISYK
ncbi:MAG: sorbosone dehydrogenase family protein [Candidatus Sericytochromatia bacterium]|nr:sorbosone dehydrogenase family protein [Candidatus Sericytochromatia bacterium]